MTCENMRPECKEEFEKYGKLIEELQEKCNKDCKDCLEIAELKNQIEDIKTEVKEGNEHMKYLESNFNSMLESNHREWRDGNGVLVNRVDKIYDLMISQANERANEANDRANESESEKNKSGWAPIINKNRKFIMGVVISTYVLLVIFVISVIVFVSKYPDVISKIFGGK